MESFNPDTQKAKIVAAFKGGPFYKNPNVPQKMSFVEGNPDTPLKVDHKPVKPMQVEDPWYGRRGR